MTRLALQDLIAPPTAGESLPAHGALEDMAETLLERLRQEDRVAWAAAPEPAQATATAVMLSAQAEDALYAWGVMCYGQGRYVDASALFGAALRRRNPSHRLTRALGAARLARHDAAGAAEAFAQASRLDPVDAEVVFHWAQAEALQAHPAEARELIRIARSLAQATASKWPALPSWCDELMMRLEPIQPSEC